MRSGMKSQSTRKHTKAIRSVCMAILLCVFLWTSTGRAEETEGLTSIESAEAATMQLMKTEGEVSVKSSSGRKISIIENMNLYNGYCTDTQEASYAWISLDSEKLTKLDAVSEAEVRKSGKKLEVLLNSGNLFFDVTRPLEEEETMNIRTSTMVMGIRGTSGWVRVIDRWHSQVYLLEGTLECRVMDPVSGQIKSVTLKGGETAEFIVYPRDRIGDKCDILMGQFTEADIRGFVLVELLQDEELCGKILEESGLDVPGLADGARSRLEAEEAEMRETMAEINGRLAEQEHHISLDPVWTEAGGQAEEQEAEEASGTADDGDSGTGGPSAGSTEAASGAGAQEPSVADSEAPADADSAASSGGSSSSGLNSPADNPSSETVPPATVNTGDDVTGSDVNDLLGQDNVNQVVVEPGGDGTLTVENGSTMNIPSEKTLTVEEGATLNVEEGASIQVDGTLDVQGELVNNGTIIVNQGG